MMLFRLKKPSISITLARAALESIYDECDKYDADETGGRLIGTYRQRGNRLEIEARDVLEPGPNAQRTATFFQQDGDHQERLFRQIEAEHPEIEHLGNWHTHHVNGYPTLSGGDKETYFRTVNHKLHNTDFFYALLVVSKNRNGDPRYNVKHFVFRRGDDDFYEIPASNVQLVDTPRLRPGSHALSGEPSSPKGGSGGANPERAKDHEFLSEFFPDFKPLVSKDSGAIYWKGRLPLIDGSRADVVAVEDQTGGHSYSVGCGSKDPAVTAILEQYKGRKFPGARHAVLSLERDLNQALFHAKAR